LAARKSARARIVWILVAVCAVLFCVGWTLHVYGQFGQQLSFLGGIVLGDTRGEIRYKLGVPSVVYGNDGSGEARMRAYYTDPEKDPTNAVPAGADIDVYPIWSYNNGPSLSAHLDLTFDPNSRRVIKITCVDQSDPPTGYCGRLVGAGIGDAELRITALFGSPTRQSIDEKTGVKTMDYNDMGVVFVLARRRVYGISVVGTGPRKQASLDRFLIWLTSDLKAEFRP
jgi:hypothetical protein